MQNHYSCAILGASFLGVGAFFASEEDVILIEASASAGYEFIEAYHPGTEWLWNDQFQENKVVSDFYCELEKKNLISEGKVHLPGVGPMLFRQINKCAKKKLFYTVIISVEKKENCFEIKLFNRSGFSTITADKILDTTKDFLSRSDFSPQFSHRSFQALLETNESMTEASSEKKIDFEIIPGRFSREAYLSIPLTKQEGFVEARELLQKIWLGKKNDLRQRYSLLSTAVRLREVPIWSETSSDWSWAPSIYYQNGIEAFFYGVKWSNIMNNKHLALKEQL